MMDNLLNNVDQNKKYRDILVEQIKSAGQQLIDRAEEMVSDNLSFITDFAISIHIPQPSDEPVTISWSTETFDISGIIEQFNNTDGSKWGLAGDNNG